uniref:Prohibitin n=1 Tax=Gongylonema pulchrum TaxID=637853 RepID=A0A183CYY4_9BILA
LLKVKDFVARASESALSLINIQTKQRGYAFAQDEGTAIAQSDMVRMYDSRVPKTPGSPMRIVTLRSSSSSKSSSARFLLSEVRSSLAY